MNSEDDSWKRRLESFRVPPPVNGRREAALGLALQARASDAPRARKRARSAARALWIGATAACLLIIGFFLRFPRESEEALAGRSLSGAPLSPDLFSEIGPLFPDQLLAVIAERGNVEVKLAESPVEMPDDQRLQVTLRRGDRECTIYTFSGNNVCLEFAGESMCVTPLIQGDGSAFVLLNERVVLPSSGPLPDGMRISTQIRKGTSS
jgi:hypothetical protein